MKALTAEQMREVDRLTTDRYGVPSLQLMENAGAAVADYLSQAFPDLSTRSILVLCGKGNNGGDGFGAAFGKRGFWRAGRPCRRHRHLYCAQNRTTLGARCRLCRQACGAFYWYAARLAG